MSQYASLLFTTDKYHEIGPFRFPIFKYLVPGEMEEIERISKQQSSATVAQMRLAKKIAKDRNITSKAAIELLTNITDAENEDLLYDYMEDLEEFRKTDSSATKTQIDYVTLIMRFRGQIKLPGSDEWNETRDWQREDTIRVPPDLLQQIFDFIIWERDGWPKPATEGKSPEEAPKKTSSPTSTK